MICPECKFECTESSSTCENCGFDLEMYVEAYNRIYNEKLQELDNANVINDKNLKNSHLHIPRCPYCGSEDLTRINAFSKVVDIAVWGIFGNKGRYQWHCNSCKTNW